MDRRRFLGATAGATALAATSCGSERARWEPSAHTRRPLSRVAVLAAADYEHPLEEIVVRGLRHFPLEVRGRRVVLKPNLVEFDPHGVVNTHPQVLFAAIEAFRRLGAGEVIVAEGPGHRRDNEYLLDASGVGPMLRDTGARYVDLNNDAVETVRLRSRFTGLGRLHLPRTILGADLLVSMPKLKTHHWAGVTLSMKNMFGIVPGSIYGWPKNVLHWSGIEESILDINAALTMPRFNIVDGIVGMEGNGPIQGTARRSGVLVFGADPVAVDATCSRLMGVDPTRVRYLAQAGEFIGNVAAGQIAQVAEPMTPYVQEYALLESFRDLRVAEATGS